MPRFFSHASGSITNFAYLFDYTAFAAAFPEHVEVPLPFTRTRTRIDDRSHIRAHALPDSVLDVRFVCRCTPNIRRVALALAQT